MIYASRPAFYIHNVGELIKKAKAPIYITLCRTVLLTAADYTIQYNNNIRIEHSTQLNCSRILDAAVAGWAKVVIRCRWLER